MSLSNETLRATAGAVLYHHSLPRVGDSNRAVVTLREILAKEAPEIRGVMLDLVCAFGRYGLDEIVRVYCKQTGLGAAMARTHIQNDAAKFAEKYGAEGEKWVRS